MFKLLYSMAEQTAFSDVAAPATSSGRLLKTSDGRERSLSEERIRFLEEEYDVWLRCALNV